MGQGTHGLALGGSVHELLTEVVPVLAVRGSLDDDLSVVIGQLEDDVLVLLRKLEVVVGSYALLRNVGSGEKKGEVSWVSPLLPCCSSRLYFWRPFVDGRRR